MGSLDKVPWLRMWGLYYRPNSVQPLTEAIHGFKGGAEDVLNNNTENPHLAIIRIFTDPQHINRVERSTLSGAAEAALRANKSFLLPVMAEGLRQQASDADLQLDSEWADILCESGPELAAVGSAINPGDALAGLATFSTFWDHSSRGRLGLLRVCFTVLGAGPEECALVQPENQHRLPPLHHRRGCKPTRPETVRHAGGALCTPAAGARRMAVGCRGRGHHLPPPTWITASATQLRFAAPAPQLWWKAQRLCQRLGHMARSHRELPRTGRRAVVCTGPPSGGSG